MRYNLSRWALGLAVVMLMSCHSSTKGTAEAEEEVLPEDIVEMRADQIKLAQIEMGSIEMRAIAGSIKTNGVVNVAPQNLAAVCMPMGGFVKSTSLMTGNAVSKGQVLATIENQDFIDIQQHYLEARNQFEFASAEYKRHNDLYEDDVYSKQNVQQVTAEYKSLQAQVKAYEQKLLLIGIDPAKLHEDDISSSVALLSPISGYIKSVNVTIGKFVAPADVLFEIVNSDKLLLELTLFDKDAGKVAVGQKIRFTINNETEQHEAVITQTGKSINSDKTINVYASVIDDCKSILPGMYVNAIIESTGVNVTALPVDAVVSFDDKDYIFVFDHDKEENGKPFTEYRMVEVRKGASDGTFIEVVLPQGFDSVSAKVVVKGAYSLLSAKKNAGEMSC